MDIDLDKIKANEVKTMNSKQLFDLLLPYINDIYQQYKYTNISLDDYSKVVLEEIEKSKKTFKDTEKYIDFISNKIKYRLVEETKDKLNNPEMSFKILNDYINQNFSSISKYTEELNAFKRLGTFLDTYDCLPSMSVLTELINKNALFNKMITDVFNKWEKQIVSGGAQNLFDDTIILLSIETYCKLKNIKVNDSNQTFIYNQDIDDSDSIGMYLREIAKRPLLTCEQEQELATRISEGDLKAKEILIESNLKLVVNIARKFLGRGLSFLDLIQEGNLGLMKAVDKYDVNKEYRFTTYATQWIRQALFRSLSNKSRNVRIPVYLQRKLAQYRHTVNKIESRLGRKATVNDIANEMNISIPEVVRLSELQSDTVSINSSIDDDQESELGDFIPSTEDTPEDIVLSETLKKHVEELLHKFKLNEREVEIIKLRYGFDGNPPMTLSEVSRKYNVTRERVRQIEAGVIGRIRRSRYIKDFAIYMQSPDKSIENINKYREDYALHKRRYKSGIDTKEEEKKEDMKLLSIYEHFKDYTREQVETMLSKLSEEDKELLRLRYGDDLENPVKQKLTDEEKDRFYGSLLPKMKRLLANPNVKRRNRTKKEHAVNLNTVTEQVVEEKVVEQTETLPVETVESPKEEPEEVSNESSKEEVRNEIKEEIQTSSKISNDDYAKLIETLKTPMFAQIISTLSIKEAVIISLKLGYVDGKYFSTEAISEFLGIEPEAIIAITKKALLLYKENVNNLLDKSIEAAIDQKVIDKTLTKKM